MNLALSLLNPPPPGSPCTLEGVPTFHLVHWCLEGRALLPHWPHLWALSALPQRPALSQSADLCGWNTYCLLGPLAGIGGAAVKRLLLALWTSARLFLDASAHGLGLVEGRAVPGPPLRPTCPVQG